MQKTKLGITTALLSATLFLSGMMGMTTLVLIAGYIFIAEEDLWLKKNAARALFIVIMFAGLSFTLDLIPSVMGVVTSMMASVGVFFEIPVVPSLLRDLGRILDIAKIVILLLCAYNAYTCKDPAIGFIDSVVEKHMS